MRRTGLIAVLGALVLAAPTYAASPRVVGGTRAWSLQVFASGKGPGKVAR